MVRMSSARSGVVDGKMMGTVGSVVGISVDMEFDMVVPVGEGETTMLAGPFAEQADEATKNNRAGVISTRDCGCCFIFCSLKAAGSMEINLCRVIFFPFC